MNTVLAQVTTKGITYVGSYWDAKTFQLVDQDGVVICLLSMKVFHDAIEAYQGSFVKVIYK